MAAALRWRVERLARWHVRAGFECGKAPLDLYFATQASQDVRRRVAACFVAPDPEAPESEDAGRDTVGVAGYYTLSAFGIDLDDLPDEIARRLPRYPIVPAILLGRLAVDRRYRGQGLGEYLLLDALRRALDHVVEVAAVAVVVDAIDEEAWRFYRHFDFEPFPTRRDRLFLPMKTVETLF